MRKSWVLGLLAASAVAVPSVASAQEGAEPGWRGARSEQRQQRQEQRQQRQEARQERQVVRQQRSDAPIVVRQRQDRFSGSSPSGPWVGNPNDPSRERYERLERQNARRYGSESQYRNVVEGQRAPGRYTREDVREDRRDARRFSGNDGRNWRGDRQDWRGGGRDRRDWNNNWRNDRRYDWRSYRNTNRFVFHIGPYYSPYRGYGYNRFSIGQVLDSLFWGRNYWISDPYQYRLPYSPPGTQWVRYYNDVVLVDTYTGEVIDVIYDFFW